MSRKFFKYTDSYIEYSFTYLHEKYINLNTSMCYTEYCVGNEHVVKIK